ncbi:Phosphotransferase [Quillaja saponaria]|uniref:Phosphotransferase n=1 Tax=Quillaja saponaria TaxID=32244 RepID=A0AAD7L718_QUISA|nr:Phosphotransferase [Quillaja saponaria]
MEGGGGGGSSEHGNYSGCGSGTSEEREAEERAIIEANTNLVRKFVRKLWQIAEDLVSNIEASLASNETSSTLNTLVSYVASLPNGGREEEDLFYGGEFARDIPFNRVCTALREE